MLPVHIERKARRFPSPSLSHPQDVDGFLDELRAFHHHFRASFERSEPWEHFSIAMVGQCRPSNANRSSRWRSTSKGATSGGCNAA